MTAIMECPDYSEFQETLRSMRKPHDIIVNTINAVVSTHSLPTDDTVACKNLHEKLGAGNSQREKFIRNCITITTDRVKQLKEHREAHLDDLQISKQLRAEQTKLRMLQVELTVEDLIKERTAKVFNERCRQYYKPL
ncbi:unnamed protein product [Phaedon cochleariae]|uniref:Protein MIX23 n=1 Tax=Phaedon cochleariae TaxID=80249 RepID=A0A9P0GRM1_PHACE|nr:unnamed protein product [Phaedon cochleariae]